MSTLPAAGSPQIEAAESLLETTKRLALAFYIENALVADSSGPARATSAWRMVENITRFASEVAPSGNGGRRLQIAAAQVGRWLTGENPYGNWSGALKVPLRRAAEAGASAAEIKGEVLCGVLQASLETAAQYGYPELAEKAASLLTKPLDALLSEPGLAY